MPVSEYVQACLYDSADGFYMRPKGGRAGGAVGHFVTSPELGPLFGAVLAQALDSWWIELGEPVPFTVIDWGAGPGTLARLLLAAEPTCLTAGALRLVLVELSTPQRALHPKHPQVISASVVSDVLPRRAPKVSKGVVLANELLDNLPFDIVQRSSHGWEELRVTASGQTDRFALTATPATEELLSNLPHIEAEDGAIIPIQQIAQRWVKEAHRLLGAGRIVVFDYGATTAELARRSLTPTSASSPENWDRDLGWLRTHRHHQDNASWLHDPGSCDITSDVAFDQMQAEYTAAICSQAEFLHRHGIEDLVEEGRIVWSQRAAAGDLEALTARSRIKEAEALTDPDGMGAFTTLTWIV